MSSLADLVTMLGYLVLILLAAIGIVTVCTLVDRGIRR